MSIKKYQFYCEICNYKRITDGTDIQDLVEIKTSPIPSGIPKRDFETKKVVISKPIKQKRKFKCPQCGRVISPKKLNLSLAPERTEEEPQEFVESQEVLLTDIIEQLDRIYGEENNPLGC
jgi:hypothetical protein